jgi:hypothetical protein
MARQDDRARDDRPGQRRHARFVDASDHVEPLFP